MLKELPEEPLRADMEIWTKIRSIIAAILASIVLIGCPGDEADVEPTDATTVDHADETDTGDRGEAKVVDPMDSDLAEPARVTIADARDDMYRNYYEVFVYSFYDGDGDGIGDLKGLTDKLDYIADLGCNGIWLMPVMPSPTYHKYDVTDYRDIDPEYGTMEDFEALLTAAHDRHINVIIDMVINHTSSKHPWFIEATDYLKSLENGQTPDPEACIYCDYYHFSDEKKDNTWYKVAGTDYYYEGSFWSEMPDLNLANESLISEIYDIADFWIEKGVDGFRMDAPLHYEETDTAFNTAVLNGLYEHCIGSDPDFYMVSEVWASENTIRDYYMSNTPSMFDFALASAEGDIVKAARGAEKADRFARRVVELEDERKSIYDAAIDAAFITNHDMPRVYNALNGKAEDMKMAAALLLSLPGNTFIYYGEEIGMCSSGKEDENKRLPMLWSDSGTSGMCEGPKDADKVEQKCKALDEQIADPSSLYNTYRKCLELRNAYPEIARGKSEIIEDLTDEKTAVIRRTWTDNGDESNIFIVYNTGKEDAALEDPILNGLEVVGAFCKGDGICSNDISGLLVPGGSVIYLK